MKFEWDPRKAISNNAKHGVSFNEAITVFRDPLSISVQDPDHSFDEGRFLIVGTSHKQRLLIISFSEVRDRIRIINARKLTRRERIEYEKNINRKE